MRDMRAGITRHMLEQSSQMTTVVAKVDALSERIDGIEARIVKLHGRMDKLEIGQQATMDSVQKVLQRLPG
jgi:uncharacterized coiled-coil DUF342 family protein